MSRLRKEIKTRKMGKYWYYNLRDQGFISSGEKTKTKCEEIARKKLQDFDDSAKMKQAKNTLFSEYAKDFFLLDLCPRTTRLIDEGRAPGGNYLRICRYNLSNHILKSKLKNLKLSEIDRSHILDVRQSLKAKKLAPATINKIFNTLNIIFKEALFRQEISFNPLEGIGTLKNSAKPKDIFTKDELTILFANDYKKIWGDKMTYTCFLCALHTGMRRSECLALKWRHVNFEKDFISIEDAWKDKNLIGPPKNGKSRIMPLSPTLKTALLSYKEERLNQNADDLVFSYIDKSRLGNTWWLKNFYNAIKKAEIKIGERKISPHSLRHQIGTQLCDAGISDDRIQAILGWSSILRPKVGQ